MEITKKAKFTTDFYGGRPYLPGSTIIQNWLESQQDKLLHPRMKELKDALGNEGKLEEILSVFNFNGENEPIIGDWMLHECSMNAAKLANTWGRFQVSADTWKDSIQFSPSCINLYQNGNMIKQPEFVEGYAITVKRGKFKGNSFFKAYQAIRTGATFEFIISFPEDLATKILGKGKDKAILPDPERSTECAEAVLEKMGIVGLGPYRLRFGKFIYV